MRYKPVTLSVLLLALSISASAVTPQFWENFTQEDLLKGSLNGISLAADGNLFLAPARELLFDTDQPYIFSMVRDAKGNLYAGTGDDGKVFRIDAQGKGTLYFKAGEINIFAMAVDGSGQLYVGTSPEGKVYKVTGPNQAAEIFDPDDKYIWSMVFDRAGNLYVGTGGGGTIYKVDGKGNGSVFYQCGDAHVRSLALDRDGSLVAGTSPGGLIIRMTPEGKGTTVLDTPMEEVHTLAFDRFGGMYAAGVSSPASGQDSTSVPGATAAKNAAASAAGSVDSIEDLQSLKQTRSTVPVSAPGKAAAGTTSAVYAISRDGSAETVYASTTQTVFDLALRDDGSILLATGPKGRLLSVDAARQVSVVTDTPDEHVTRLLTDGETVYAGSSNQGRVYRLDPQKAGTGVFESKILDAETTASWGKISWHVVNPGGARIEFSTRTGNTETVDGSWSDWSAPCMDPGSQVVSPKARYLQWRVSVTRNAAPQKAVPSDLVSGIQIAYLEQNLRPRMQSIEVLSYGIEFQRQPSLSGGMSMSVPATTPDGRSLNAPRERERREPNQPPRQVLLPGAQSFTWKAADDNRDSLEYSIYFKGEAESDWKMLEEKYSDTFYTLYAASLPDGIYRLKVLASDAPSNPYDGFLVSELVSRPFVIANTPPQIEIIRNEIKGNKVEITFRASVQAGSIASSEFSVDGDDWRLVFPVDGIADSPAEEFRITTPYLATGEHLIGLRAGNRDGNTGITKLVVRVP